MGVPWDFQFDADTDDAKLDANHQLAVTTSYPELVCTRIRNRLRTVQGEHYQNRDLGVPWFSEVCRKNPDLERVKNLLIASIADVKGVKKVLSFVPTFDPATRTYSAIFKVLADTDEVVSGEV